jgi:hypothetical protein
MYSELAQNFPIFVGKNFIGIVLKLNKIFDIYWERLI